MGGQYGLGLWFLALLLLPLWESVTFSADEPSWQQVFNAGQRLQQEGQYEEAVKKLGVALRKAETSGGDETLVKTLISLGSVYQDLGQLNKAMKCYRRSLKVLKKDEKRNPSEFATILNNLAVVHSEMGQHAKAEDYFVRHLNCASGHSGLITQR